ncbi:MAG: hypothetical protein JO046_22105 [Solirubrobacterales bacterium]|nr:hypothetical protein [Solirubrobacterales bacterium]MBV9364256.1 hypothetical protein [Solirubrobacterales bacterium]MBV9684502.1 hypothetical protein [Solirubrobacterales bacterium]
MFQDPNHEAPTGLEYDCPTCGTRMEVVDRFVLYGVPAPVEHVKVRCPSGHWFTIPTEGHAQRATPEEVSATSSVVS